MGRDRKLLDLEGLVKKLRYVTTAVQVMPFVYGIVYAVAIIASMWAPDNVVRLLDELFYASPVVIFAFLVLSRLLRLCKWHRAACVLPLLPQAVSMVDYYIIELSEVLAQVNIILFGSMAIMLIVSAYNVFFR